MSTSIRVDDELYTAAKYRAAAEFRSIPQQIEYWARVGKAVLDNPDLPAEFVRDVLMAKAANPIELEPFTLGQK